ncbi:glycosyltransferase [Demequina sp. B12]|uniref:glycosyltransferase n=1 Tax=Demequina sp. B12 TaxID=2992757 RepID=UPI00237A9E96|nr:glycosyltransferase [Demequina sp. B12]MDE0573531.1 glycosyltransferase [Demequina sp. B12]
MLSRSVRSSLETHATEILLVPTRGNDDLLGAQSTDSRVSLAPHTWTGSFSDARNHALRAAKNDVVMFLDSDEWIDQRSTSRVAEEIRRAQGNSADLMSYRIVDESTGQASTGVPRVILNRHQTRYEGYVHEAARMIAPRAAVIESSDLSIHHSGYSLDEDAMRRKYNRNLTLLSRDIAENPGRARNYVYLARHYLASRDNSRVLEAQDHLARLGRDDIRDHLCRDDYLDGLRLECCYHQIGIGDWHSLREFASQFVEIPPYRYAENAYFLAVSRLMLGDADQNAAAILVDSLEAISITSDSLLSSDGLHVAAVCVAIFDALGLKDAASLVRGNYGPWTDAFFLNSKPRYTTRHYQ